MVHFYVFWEHKMDCNSLQYRAYYHAYHNYIGIDKGSGPPIQGRWQGGVSGINFRGPQQVRGPNIST